MFLKFKNLKFKIMLGITKKVMAILKLGDSGKIDNFFLKQVKNCEKSIRDLKRNKVTLENSYKDEVEEIQEQLEDAKEALQESYKNITSEDVKTNALASKFEEVYWNRVSEARNEVKRIEYNLEEAKTYFDEEIKEMNEQISLYEERITSLIAEE